MESKKTEKQYESKWNVKLQAKPTEDVAYKVLIENRRKRAENWKKQ
ncbi:hypothetical protein [Alkaliphilus metalliredigens]|nr:hypothetical protein [Alkaliphilus metalliredigens]